jgi:chromosome segregation ATPase
MRAINDELSTQILENKELNKRLVDLREEFAHRLQAISEEIELSNNNNSMHSESRLIEKLEQKNEQVTSLQQRISEIRTETESEISKYKTLLKSLRKQIEEYNQKFDVQQEELDSVSIKIIQKDNQVEMLTETIGTIQNDQNNELVNKYLDQNAELLNHKTLNMNLENEVKT